MLKVRDAPWNLIGKKRVAIESADPGLATGVRIRLTNGGRAVVAAVDSVAANGNNTVCLDRDLRDNLGVDIGHDVRAEVLPAVPDARKVRLSFTGKTPPRMDAVRAILQGSVLCEGNRERHIAGKDELLFVVVKTEPEGPVLVASGTLLEIGQSPSEDVARALPVYADGSSGISIVTEQPTQRFADVGGLEGVKKLLAENILFALQKDKAALFSKMGYRPPRGVLLHGPPGTGKTLLARATAGESGACFISVPGSKFKNKWFGETEHMIRDVFKAAREMAPCIIFIDEIDAIAYARGTDGRINVINQLLVALDENRGLDVFVIGATNLLPMIDPALLQPSRLLPVEVGIPDAAAREHIFRIHLKGMSLGRGDLGRLVRLTEGCTGAGIELACNRARMAAMRETNFSPETRLEVRHLLAAIDDRPRGSGHLSEYI